MVNIPKYVPEKHTNDIVPKKMSSPKPSNRIGSKDCRFTRTHAGQAKGISYQRGNVESFEMGHTGSGQWTYDNGEMETRMHNGMTTSGYGGIRTMNNGNQTSSCGGSSSGRSTGSSQHVSSSTSGQLSGAKPTKKTKMSGDGPVAYVTSSDIGVVAGTIGIGGDNVNMKAEKGFAISSPDGSGSIVSNKDFACGSQSGNCQVGAGKNVTFAAGTGGGGGGAVSFQATGGNVSASSDKEIRLTGAKICINCSDSPAETPSQVIGTAAVS
jgi:hypothetical protein